jgi:hypothetical protein
MVKEGVPHSGFNAPCLTSQQIEFSQHLPDLFPSVADLLQGKGVQRSDSDIL